MSLFPEQPYVIASVLLPKPLPEPFDYRVPDDVEVSTGMFVEVPLGPRTLIGVVWSVRQGPADRPLKTLIGVLPDTPIIREPLREFVEWTARYCCSPAGNILAMCMRSRDALQPSPVEKFIRRGEKRELRLTPAREKTLAAFDKLESEFGPDLLLSAAELARRAESSPGVIKGLVEAGVLRQVELAADQPFEAPDITRQGFELTEDQSTAVTDLRQSVSANAFRPVLLDGVTGSGKTEVYFEAIIEALKDPDAQVLVLLPEIALTQAVRTRFTNRFGAAPAEWHSGASAKQRRRVWREVVHGRARIVVGARSALFLPFRNLRLIVVDEEHDGSYKQDEGVCYQARDLSVMRARLEEACVVLASATPSLETHANAELGRYKRLVLKARPGAAVLPEIFIADMRETPPEKGQLVIPHAGRRIDRKY